jgi:hypothetical protein
MVKRMCIVVSLLSMVSIMNGMNQGMDKRSAGNVLHNILDAVVGAASADVGIVENELEAVAHEAQQEISSMDPKMVWNALVVCSAIYGTAEGIKWAWNRYGVKPLPGLDSHTLAQGAAVTQAGDDANKLATFISKQAIDAMVQAKWNELVTSSTISSLTQAAETTAGRVKTLEGQVSGLMIVVQGDPASNGTKPGIVSKHESLSNYVAGLANQKQLASSSAPQPAAHKEGFLSRILHKGDKSDKSGTPGAKIGSAVLSTSDDDDDDNDDHL